MISIKYSGSVKDRKNIRKLEEEFIDICRISGWNYELVTENFQTLTMKGKDKKSCRPEDETGEEELRTVSSSEVYLEGIIISPGEGAEPMRFTFDKDGRLSTINFCTTDTIGVSGKLTVKKFEFIYYPYIKIVTGTPENHTRAVKILEHVKKSYVPDLRVLDTSSFWLSRDDEELKVKFWKSTGGGRNVRR